MVEVLVGVGAWAAPDDFFDVVARQYLGGEVGRECQNQIEFDDVALNTYPWVTVWVVGHSALHLPKVRPSVSRSGLPFPPLVLSVCAWECYLVAFCWKRKGPRKETKIKKPFSNQIDPFSNQNDSDGISVFCLMTWHLIPYLWGWVWEVGHSALHFPTQYIQGEPFGTALPTISPVWVWAVLLKRRKGKQYKVYENETGGLVLTTTNHMESVRYLKWPRMTPKCSICFIFGLFDCYSSVFVQLRWAKPISEKLGHFLVTANHMEGVWYLKWPQNDLFALFLDFLIAIRLSSSNYAVCSYTYLHHLQSHVQSILGEAWTLLRKFKSVYWSRFLWWILPYSYYNSSDSPGKIQFTVCELNWKLVRFLELLESLHYTLMFHPNPKREWSPLFKSRESRSYQIIESEINTQTQKMARAWGYEYVRL